MHGNNTYRVTLSIPEGVLQEARKQAQKMGISLSAYITIMLTKQVLTA